MNTIQCPGCKQLLEGEFELSDELRCPSCGIMFIPAHSPGTTRFKPPTIGEPEDKPIASTGENGRFEHILDYCKNVPKSGPLVCVAMNEVIPENELQDLHHVVAQWGMTPPKTQLALLRCSVSRNRPSSKCNRILVSQEGLFVVNNNHLGNGFVSWPDFVGNETFQNRRNRFEQMVFWLVSHVIDGYKDSSSKLYLARETAKANVFLSVPIGEDDAFDMESKVRSILLGLRSAALADGLSNSPSAEFDRPSREGRPNNYRAFSICMAVISLVPILVMAGCVAFGSILGAFISMLFVCIFLAPLVLSFRTDALARSGRFTQAVMMSKWLGRTIWTIGILVFGVLYLFSQAKERGLL